MLKRFFNFQTKSITSAAFLVGISTIASGVLGLVRDRLLAGRFGAGEELDVYFAAFRIPDFVYGILITGGIAAVFLPVFSEYFKKSEKEAWEFTNNLLNCFLVLLFALCVVLALFAPLIINLVAPGFSFENKEITVNLVRIMFLSPILFGLSNIFSGILQYFNRFLVYSIAPILYNLGIIVGILFFVPVFGLYGLAYGVILGAVFYWILQIPAARSSGYKYSPTFNFKYPGLIKSFKLMIPRAIGAAAYHINLITVTAIASTLTVGSIAIFNFSNNIQYFPIGLFGTSFAIAAFPALSQSWATRSKEKFLGIFSSTFRQIIFLIIPTSLMLFIFRAQMVRLILGTGEFGWLETRLTAASLGIFCIGIFASAFIPFLARVFYSLQDTKTPVFISLFSMALNMGLCFLLTFLLSSANSFHKIVVSALKLQDINNIAVLGLPMALSFSAIFQFAMLLFYLKKKLVDIKIR
ncbi:MAG: murein biosynthesis integral membrane protein MurJ [Parcubacteria group bacterium]|nr:MAG: murein biosynthesis integral membrane protein MurJ [Parcubacteria group bacterium]